MSISATLTHQLELYSCSLTYTELVNPSQALQTLDASFPQSLSATFTSTCGRGTHSPIAAPSPVTYLPSGASELPVKGDIIRPWQSLGVHLGPRMSNTKHRGGKVESGMLGTTKYELENFQSWPYGAEITDAYIIGESSSYSIGTRTDEKEVERLVRIFSKVAHPCQAARIQAYFVSSFREYQCNWTQDRVILVQAHHTR